jgi:hypothetical protein
MKILGTATALATGTTKFTTGVTAVWVSNTANSAGIVTLRNTADDGDLGSISVPPVSGVVIHMDAGNGLRGPATCTGTHVDASSGS